ncbi:MAG: hypothetical protein LUG99_11365 [Lachnospiraceae bacterium]|nr:hypothetical protein [Lachnospiraceae bacterium]
MSRDIVKAKQYLTYLSWTKSRNSSGTVGSFLKAYSELGDKKSIISFPTMTACAA